MKKLCVSWALLMVMLFSSLPISAVEDREQIIVPEISIEKTEEALPEKPETESPAEAIVTAPTENEADDESPDIPIEPSPSPEAVAPLPQAEDVTVTIVSCPEKVYLKNAYSVTVSIAYTGEPALCGAVWMFDHKPIPGFSNESFVLTDGKTSTLNWNVPEDWYKLGAVKVSFMLYVKDKELHTVHRNITVIDAESEDAYLQQKAAQESDILSIVKPVKVEATVRYDTSLYSDVMLKNRIGTVKGGTACQVLNSKSGYSNQILTDSGTRGWVSLSSLSVSQKNYTKETDLTNRQKDQFVNAKGYKSKTDYLIWVHLETQTVNVYLRKGGLWHIEKVMPCASGKNVTPTINGVFAYDYLVKRWPYEHYYVGPVMVFHGNYAIHSVLMRYDGTVYDGTVGRPASNGCVRVLQPDMQWLVDYVPVGTTVVVY
ncbi:MAG: L,D-transpeptidase [Ruminococcaceae bacterium]|nr:L,D-transpeptidase [Oscillospiraceae bacterium]